MDYSQNTLDTFHRSSRTRTLHSRDTIRKQDSDTPSIPVGDFLAEKTGEGQTIRDYSDWEKDLFFTCEEDSDMGFIFETARNSPYSSDTEDYVQADEYEKKDSILEDYSSYFPHSNSSYNHLIVNTTNMSLEREFIDEFRDVDADSSDFNLLLNHKDSAGQKQACQIELNNNKDGENHYYDDGDESSNATEILFERFKEIDYDFNDPGYHSPSSLSFSCGSQECICHGRSSPVKLSSSFSSISSDNQNRKQDQRQNQCGKNNKRVAPTPEEITRFWTSPSLPEPFQLSEMIIKLLRESECL